MGLNEVFKKVADIERNATELAKNATELASHKVDLAKSLQELDAMYAEIQKAGANDSKYISSLKEAVNYFNNTGKSYNVLVDRYQAEVKGTIAAAKQLGLEIPASTVNNTKFVGMFKDRAKVMFSLANNISAGLSKI